MYYVVLQMYNGACEPVAGIFGVSDLGVGGETSIGAEWDLFKDTILFLLITRYFFTSIPLLL